MNFLKELLLEKGVTQRQAIEDTHISNYTFTSILNGKHKNIQITTVKKLSDYFGINAVEFQKRFEKHLTELQTKKDQETPLS